jgi:hypothetical protein
LSVGYVLNQSAPVVGHSNNETVTVFVQMNEGVTITDANTANVYIVLIGTNANANGNAVSTNVNAAYVASLSVPESGMLVFQKTGVDLSAMIANSTLVLNATSILHHANAAVARQSDHNPTLNTANATPFGNVGLTINIF